MSEPSTKPYLLRAIYDYCTDHGYTPHIVCKVDERTEVPTQYVKNGEITFNISFDATSGLKMDDDYIRFKARFAGVSREIVLPVENILAIYSRENAQGMSFEYEEPANREDRKPPAKKSEASPLTEVPGLTPTLTAVPSFNHAKTEHVEITPEDHPDPPKKGGRPTLTRIK